MFLNALLFASMLNAHPIANLSPVSFTDVVISDHFWAPKREVNRKVSIPHTLMECEQTGRMANFDAVAKGENSGHKGYVFDDSDVYKSLEAAAYSLAQNNDPVLDKRVDALIARVGAAQMKDGYIDTAYQLGRIEKRFTNLADDHELYCAGHLIEAGVAHFQATKKRTLLDIAIKCADLLCRTFGKGKRMGYPGHPEVELAILKLWKLTGVQKYFDLAQFFLENRGSRFFAIEKGIPKASFNGTYWLDDVPIRDHKEIKGHAVRAAYLFSGACDLAAATKDETLRVALDRVWQNTVTKRVFVTGGIGPSASNEGFTVDYDLPNESAYQETCASVAMVLWNHRMGLMEGQAKYWDWVERALYNGFLSGVSQSGDRFYYVNPLASTGDHHRVAWFGCACCPPNVTRTLASLGQYIYAKSADSLYVNLYVGGRVTTRIGAQEVDVKVDTEYPNNGDVKITFMAGTTANLRLRIPDWAGNAQVFIKGHKVETEVTDGYAALPGPFGQGDTVEITFPFAPFQVAAHPDVKEDAGRLALQRGPVLYCFEGVDQTSDLARTFITPGTAFRANGNQMEGVSALEGEGMVSQMTSWKNSLYLPTRPVPTKVVAIPYFAWDNRAPCEMEVWMPTAPVPQVSGGPEAEASLALSYKSELCTPEAIRDHHEFSSSGQHPGKLFHFWPHKGTQEWVSYSWPDVRTFTGVQVYWFDDTGVGECRPPADWHIEAMVDGHWQPVKAEKYPIFINGWCEAKFAPIKATALRLVMKFQANWSVGIQAWKVFEVPD